MERLYQVKNIEKSEKVKDIGKGKSTRFLAMKI